MESEKLNSISIDNLFDLHNYIKIPYLVSQQYHTSTQLTYNQFLFKIEALEKYISYQENIETLFLASIVTVFHRYCGQDTICFLVQQNSTKLLLLNLDLSGEITFKQLCTKISNQQQQQQNYMDQSALLKLLQESNSNDSREFCHIILGFSCFTSKLLQWPFDLFIEFGRATAENVKQFTMAINYSNRIELKQVEYLCTHISNVLEDGLAYSDYKIDSLNLISKEERKEILCEFNSTSIPPKCCQSAYLETILIGIFKQNMFQKPFGSKIAIVEANSTAFTADSKDTEITYQQVHERSLTVASFLNRKKLKARFIASMLPICSEFIYTSLATIYLKKTAAVIHDSYSSGQVRDCLEILGYPILVTSQLRYHQLGFTYENVIFIEEIMASMTVNGLSTSKSIFSDTDQYGVGQEIQSGIPYCLFTSGSTGKPKPVLIREESIINAIRYRQHTLAITKDSRLLLLVPNSFIPSTIEIWTTFLAGATIYIPSLPELRLNFNLLRPWIYQHQITDFGISCTVLKLLLAKDGHYLNSVGWIKVGGELLRGLDPNNLSTGDNFNVCTVYGGTEFGIATLGKLDKANQYTTTELISSGKPIWNMKIYILDKHLKLAPIGIKGDIYLSGIGVMEGYFQTQQLQGLQEEKDLNSKAFITNPFIEDYKQEMGENQQQDLKMYSRMYRTGDIGYWSFDGNLFVVGRNDNQIKIHGNRLEIEDIEAKIMEFHGIKQAAIAVREIESVKQLIAYCVLTEVAKSESETEKEFANNLKEFLNKRLQKHAIPSNIYIVDELPKTSSGKINRHALNLGLVTFADKNGTKVCDKGHIYTPMIKDNDYIAIAAIVKKIWAEVIGIPEHLIREDESFFQIGGNSALVFTLLDRLAENLHLPDNQSKLINAKHVFEYPELNRFTAFMLQIISSKNGKNIELSKPVAIQINFEKDVELPRNFFENSATASLKSGPQILHTKASSILLTGSTGYFGAALLIELLARTDFQIICLIRAKNESEAKERLLINLDNHHLMDLFNQHKGNSRTNFITCDLSAEKFGLIFQEYDKLANKVNSVYNCAAEVNFMKNYLQLRESTISIIKNLLQFCMDGRLKRLHHISSVGVIISRNSSSNGNSTSSARTANEPPFLQLDEENCAPDLIYPNKLLNGYCQSKWVAEKLIWAAAAVIPSSIYRLGLVGAHSKLPMINRNDALAGFLLTCKVIKSRPHISMANVPFIPVDDASEAIVKLSLKETAANAEAQGQSCQLFHVISGNIILDSFFADEQEEQISKMSVKEWEDKLRLLSLERNNKSTDLNVMNALIFLEMLKMQAADQNIIVSNKKMMGHLNGEINLENNETIVKNYRMNLFI